MKLIRTMAVLAGAASLMSACGGSSDDLGKELGLTQPQVHFIHAIPSGPNVDFYDNDQRYIESRVLQGGDVILLATGGHGFEVLEEIEMIEVKQGPYAGDNDKTRFDGVSAEQVTIGRGSGR